MVLYECRSCGDWSIDKPEYFKHMREEHNAKKGDELVVMVIYRDVKNGGYKNPEQKFITMGKRPIVSSTNG